MIANPSSKPLNQRRSSQTYVSTRHCLVHTASILWLGLGRCELVAVLTEFAALMMVNFDAADIELGLDQF